MVVQIGFPVLLRVLIWTFHFRSDLYGLSDRVSRLVSGINPCLFVLEVIFTCWGKTKETLIGYS